MKGKLKQSLTTEAVLSKVSEYDIYRYYLGHDFIEGTKYPSPFRSEKDGSFSIKRMNNGHLKHRDFGPGGNKGNYIDFIMQLYPGLTFYDTLVRIDKDMRLGILGGDEGYKDVVRGYRTQTAKREKLLQVSPRPLDGPLLAYWKKRGLIKKDLEVDPKVEVFGINYLRLNRIKIHIPPSEVAFAYLYEGKYWKVYRPQADPKFKWVSNVPLTHSFGLQNLDANHNSLIMKAVKDYFVLLKIYPHICGIQNESREAFSEETVNHIKSNSRLIYYGGDNDEPGKKASYEITKAFDFNHVNVPDQYKDIINPTFPKGVKDWDNWAEYEGLKKIEHYLKKKKII